LRAARLAILILLLCSLAAVSSACPALMVPGLAYSGYEEIKEKDTGTAADQEANKPATKSNSSKSSSDNFE
jgi:hypothetical protein